MGSGVSTIKARRMENAQLPVVPIRRLKIVLIGEPRAGKTSVFLRYIRNQFDPHLEPTSRVTIDTAVKSVGDHENPQLTSLRLWDLPSREEYDLRREYYHQADAAIVVCDLTQPDLDMARRWRMDVVEAAQADQRAVYGPGNLPSSAAPQISSGTRRRTSIFGRAHEADGAGPAAPQPVLPVFLIGNKLDLCEEETHDARLAELKRFARENGFVDAYACSASDNATSSVSRVFQSMLVQLGDAELIATYNAQVGSAVSAVSPDRLNETALAVAPDFLPQTPARLDLSWDPAGLTPAPRQLAAAPQSSSRIARLRGTLRRTFRGERRAAPEPRFVRAAHKVEAVQRMVPA